MPSHSRIFSTRSWLYKSLLTVFSLRSIFLLTLTRALTATSGVLNYINSFYRPFLLTNASIAFLSKLDIILISIVIIVTLVIPTAIIVVFNFGVIFLFHDRTKKYRFRRMLYEIYVSLLGLYIGLAITLFVMLRLKDMVRKPRPNLLARYKVDLSNVSQYIVGDFSNSLNFEAESLVISTICK